MADQHYEHPDLAALYDLDSPWSVDRDFYLSLAGSEPIVILDVGCGTGLLADAYAAQGHDVTGVDSAGAMLAVARRKPNGGRVDWIQSTAQDFRTDKRFDLVVMTGNAFQVFLTEAEVRTTFSAMAFHLKPEGRIVFETRNPALDWPALVDRDMTLSHDGLTVIEERRFRRMDGPVMTFELNYRFPERTISTESRIRFWSRQDVEFLATEAGLVVKDVLGDWDGEPLDEGRSEEIVFVLGAA